MVDIVERLRSGYEIGLIGVPENQKVVIFKEAAKQIERLREALEEIMHYDVAWHSEEVGTVDGPCAALARAALKEGK